MSAPVPPFKPFTGGQLDIGEVERIGEEATAARKVNILDARQTGQIDARGIQLSPNQRPEFWGKIVGPLPIQVSAAAMGGSISIGTYFFVATYQFLDGSEIAAASVFGGDITSSTATITFQPPPWVLGAVAYKVYGAQTLEGPFLFQGSVPYIGQTAAPLTITDYNFADNTQGLCPPFLYAWQQEMESLPSIAGTMQDDAGGRASPLAISPNAAGTKAVPFLPAYEANGSPAVPIGSQAYFRQARDGQSYRFLFFPFGFGLGSSFPANTVTYGSGGQGVAVRMLTPNNASLIAFTRVSLITLPSTYFPYMIAGAPGEVILSGLYGPMIVSVTSTTKTADGYYPAAVGVPGGVTDPYAKYYKPPAMPPPGGALAWSNGPVIKAIDINGNPLKVQRYIGLFIGTAADGAPVYAVDPMKKDTGLCCDPPPPNRLYVRLTKQVACDCLDGVTFPIDYDPNVVTPSGSLGMWVGTFTACGTTNTWKLWCETPSFGDAGWSYAIKCGNGAEFIGHNTQANCSPFDLNNTGFAVWSTCCTGSLNVHISECPLPWCPGTPPNTLFASFSAMTGGNCLPAGPIPLALQFSTDQTFPRWQSATVTMSDGTKLTLLLATELSAADNCVPEYLLTAECQNSGGTITEAQIKLQTNCTTYSATGTLTFSQANGCCAGTALVVISP